MRISKTVSDTVSGKTTSNTTVYVYNDGLLINETTDKDRITYYYDGEVIEIGYQVKSGNTFGDETRYFFSRNVQGDIVAVYRSKESVLMGTYDYDLWGNITVVEKAKDKKGNILDTLGILNRSPLRYRGYYYDAESNFYYLNARYYDPITHRFINSDSQIAGVSGDVSGYNLFEYCNNNPVKMTDASGEWPKLSNKAKVGIGLAVIAVCAVAAIALTGPAGAIAIGALKGAVTGAVIGAASGAATNGAITYITSGGDIEATKQAAIDGAADGFMTGAITGAIAGCKYY